MLAGAASDQLTLDKGPDDTPIQYHPSLPDRDEDCYLIPASSPFCATFSFRIIPPAPEDEDVPADGFTFAIFDADDVPMDTPDDDWLDEGGWGWGYLGTYDDGGSAGTSPGWAVEFDLFNNGNLGVAGRRRRSGAVPHPVGGGADPVALRSGVGAAEKARPRPDPTTTVPPTSAAGPGTAA